MNTVASESLVDEVISAYGRTQAIQDGVLVDVSEMAGRAGFRIPVALTANVWTDCVEWSEEDSKRQCCQDQSGRLWDVLWMAYCTARTMRECTQLTFSVLRVPRGGQGATPRRVRLKMAIAPGDAGEPVLTIMFPNED